MLSVREAREHCEDDGEDSEPEGFDEDEYAARRDPFVDG